MSVGSTPSRAEQLVLDLAFRPALGREDFLVSSANEAAVAWLDRWPDWPAGGLLLLGPSASGKSHLAAVWRQRSGAQPHTGALDPEDGFAERHWLIDDLEEWLAQDGRRAQALFHLYNHIQAARGSLLLTARRPVEEMGLALADLRSRLSALPVAVIGPPDDALLGALLVKQFADRRLDVGADVVAYILNRVDRSFAGVRDAAARIDKAALARRRKVTVDLARDIWGRASQDRQERET